jgi:phage terminase small subunit
MQAHVQSNPRPLSDRQERFIHEYLIDHNASAAAVRAGYSPKSKGSTAAELLQDERVSMRIAVEMADLFARLKVNALDLMRRQLNLADLDPAKLFDDDEEAIPIKDLDEDTKRALNVNYDKRRGVTVMKVRATPRHIALAALWRRFDVMMKMRALALADARQPPQGAASAVPAAASLPRVPIDPMTTPVGLNLQRIRDEAQAREARERAGQGAQQGTQQGTQAGQVSETASVQMSPQKSPLDIAEEEADARLREAREAQALARANYERVRREEEARACAAAAPVGPGEAVAATQPAVEMADAPATSPELVTQQESAPVEAEHRVPTRLDEAALQRERAACEKAREADIDRRMARLMARDGKLPPGEGPKVWRAARAAWDCAVKVAKAQREARQVKEAKLFAPKPTPEPEMKQSLIEHLLRVKRQDQQEELRGVMAARRREGKIAPGVIVGTGNGKSGKRPPGYNPPWERDTRPRYAIGHGEFNWSD